MILTEGSQKLELGPKNRREHRRSLEEMKSAYVNNGIDINTYQYKRC